MFVGYFLRRNKVCKDAAVFIFCSDCEHCQSEYV